MRAIGYFYNSKYAIFFVLYAADTVGADWPTNLCYYNHIEKQYYGPRLSAIAANSIDQDGSPHPEHYWALYVKAAQPSFVMNRV